MAAAPRGEADEEAVGRPQAGRREKGEKTWCKGRDQHDHRSGSARVEKKEEEEGKGGLR